MKTLGYGMAAVFGLAFLGLGLYLLIDRLRTGELFRQKRLTYVAFTAAALTVAGILIISAN